MCPRAAACVLMLLYTAIYACTGVKAEGGNDGDAQGLEKHNQFLWAKKMGQQNEPRWGLFKQVEYYYMCPHTIIEQNEPRWGLFKQVACCYICVLKLLYVCHHTTGAAERAALGAL
jgi:hypothetical protein